MKWKHTKSTKYHYLFFMTKYVLNDGIDTLAYFHNGFKKQFLTDDYK